MYTVLINACSHLVLLIKQLTGLVVCVGINYVPVRCHKPFFNPLPNMPILGSSNSVENKDMMSKEGLMEIQLSDKVENIVGKGEIAHYEQFLLFRQCFQKLSVVDASK